jgi:hypothetical protein
VDQLQEQLEAARLAIVSLLAVMTDEQFQAVEAALEAIAAMSDTAPAALEELRVVRRHQQPTRKQDQPAQARAAIERHLSMQDRSG